MNKESISNGRENKPSERGRRAISPGGLFLIMFSIILSSISVAFSGLDTVEEGYGVDIPKVEAAQTEGIGLIPNSVFEVISETVREVTAYNVGVAAQTDDYPCIGATGENLCEKIALGERICAANGFPFGTRLHIENYGECLVLDRMNRRYRNRVDIAMGPDEVKRARHFGIQRLKIGVLEEVD